MEGSVMLVVFILSFYFWPLWIALIGRKQHTAGIFVLNLFLGWTFVGWVIAMVWAVSDTKKG